MTCKKILSLSQKCSNSSSSVLSGVSQNKAVLAGTMAMSLAGGAVSVSAEEGSNKLTIWAWDQNFNIKSMQIAADQYAKSHEGFEAEMDCSP